MDRLCRHQEAFEGYAAAVPVAERAGLVPNCRMRPAQATVRRLAFVPGRIPARE
jgi:hypothetical protein